MQLSQRDVAYLYYIAEKPQHTLNLPPQTTVNSLLTRRSIISKVNRHTTVTIYTGCNRRNGPDFGRVFLMLNYTEKPQNTYIQS